MYAVVDLWQLMPHDQTREQERIDRAWVKFIGKRRLSQFERALTDPDLISLKQEIIKLDLRIAELEERFEDGEVSRPTGDQMKSLIEDALVALDGDDLDAARTALTRAQAQLERAQERDHIWDQVLDVMERRRRFADTERKYEELMKVWIPATQLTRLFDDLHAAVEAALPSREDQLKVLYEVRSRLNGDRRGKTDLIPLKLPGSFLVAPAAPGQDQHTTAIVVEESLGARGEESTSPSDGEPPPVDGASSVGD